MRKLLLALFCLLITLPSFAFLYTTPGGVTLNFSIVGKSKCSIVGFSGCPWSIYIPEKVPYNGIEYTVITIEPEAFRGLSSLTDVTIPNSVTSIGNYAFSLCTNLQSVNIPNSVTSIGDGAFNGCYKLESVTIPNSVTLIGYAAFRYCESLTSVTIPTSVTSIKSETFSSCESLTSVTIPNSVTSIGYKAFYCCRKLTSLTIPNSVTSIGASAFYGCNILKTVTIPNSVTSIDNRAFIGCESLTSVTIPNSVTTIGNYAFSNCTSLRKLILGSGLQEIDQSTFSKCFNLDEVTSLAVNPPRVTTDDNKFALTECNLYVPQGSEEAYRNAYWWNEFASINKEIKHSISLQVSGGGVLKCNGVSTTTASVSEGSTAIITVAPSAGWILKRLLVDNVDVTDKVASNEYRIENVKTPHTVKAEFVERPINLTIKYPGIGTAVHSLAKGTQFTTNFVAENGWLLASASWNGDDVTTKFSNGGKFTTPVLNTDAELSIVLKKGDAAMESVLNDVVKVTAYNGVINVIGAENGTQVSVTDVKGNTVINTEISDANQTISVNKSGVFIVNVDNATYKVAL